MKRYNADKGCEKCGADVHNVSFQYVAGTTVILGDGNPKVLTSVPGLDDEGFISRECRNCGYQWLELPLDAVLED